RGVPLTPNLRTIVPRGSAPTASLQCARLVIKPEKKLNFFLLASKKIHAVACPSENKIRI
ncbi:MAG: hypothetical protein J6P19_04870, partial [Acetobacter sp.]|nr:hypothetical protein [Acetobacter sp.]